MLITNIQKHLQSDEEKSNNLAVVNCWFRHTMIFIVLLCISSAIIAQSTYSVSGHIFNPADQLPLPGATVIALSETDSSMISGTTTDPEGYFNIKNLPSADYLLKVTFVGHKPMYKSFTVNERSLGLGMMVLKQNSTKLKEFEVVSRHQQIIQKEDTLVYNAAAVNVGYGATAQQLLSKMSGIRVHRGQFQAQGEEILEITVNGQRFFEGDLETALRMLPAESVHQVEVFNHLSDRSRLTGIDEGNPGKTINIVTTEAYKKNMFGRAYAGAGAQGEYQGGGNLNLMDENQRATILLQSNNINQQNFAQEDVSEVSSISNSTTPGVSSVNAGGIDFMNNLNENTEITGTYFIRQDQNHTETELLRDYLPSSGSELRYTENSTQNSTKYSHNGRMRLQHSLNSRSTLLFQPSVSTYNSKSKRALNSQSLQQEMIVNSSYSSFASIDRDMSIMAPVTFTHRFKQRGRTLTTDFNPSYVENSGENDLINYSTFFNPNPMLDTLAQSGLRQSKTWNISGGISASEAIGEKGMLYLHWRGSLKLEDSDDRVFRDDDYFSETQNRDSLLSNAFSSNEFTQRITPEYHFRTDKSHFKVGVGYQITSLNSTQQFPHDAQINRQFSTILPSLMWRFKIEKSKTLNFSYNGSNRTPSIFQLQTVPDNTNPIRQFAGSPDLSQEIRHRMRLNYSSSNIDKGSVLMVGLFMTAVQNYISNSVITAHSDTLINDRIMLQKGGQLILPTNMNGYINLGANISIDTELPAINSNFNSGLAMSYSRVPGLINNQVNHADVKGVEVNLGLTSNISKEIDFDIHSSTHVEHANFTLNPEFNNNIVRQHSSARLRWMLWKGLTFTADLNHQVIVGMNEHFDQQIILCNLGLGYRFLSQKQAELRITLFDLFNQNNYLDRSFSDVYVDDYRSNVLNRYAMLSFTYQLHGKKK